MSQDKITVVEIQETRYGEEAYLDSPFEAKDYLKYTPWSADQGFNADELDEEPDFDFPDGFETHRSWDGDKSMWKVDADSLPVLQEYFVSVGFEFAFVDGIDVQATL